MITNKLTFDPPTRLPELTQNLIRSSHGHSTPSPKISCKSVQPFSRNVADKETKKERNRPNTIPRPPTGGGVKIHFGRDCKTVRSKHGKLCVLYVLCQRDGLYPFYRHLQQPEVVFLRPCQTNQTSAYCTK